MYEGLSRTKIIIFDCGVNGDKIETLKMKKIYFNINEFRLL